MISSIKATPSAAVQAPVSDNERAAASAYVDKHKDAILRDARRQIPFPSLLDGKVARIKDVELRRIGPGSAELGVTAAQWDLFREQWVAGGVAGTITVVVSGDAFAEFRALSAAASTAK